MTLTQSDVTELLDDTEATERIGAGRYERSDTRSNQRNNSRERLLTTKAGDVELRDPKLRKATFSLHP